MACEQGHESLGDHSARIGGPGALVTRWIVPPEHEIDARVPPSTDVIVMTSDMSERSGEGRLGAYALMAHGSHDSPERFHDISGL